MVPMVRLPEKRSPDKNNQPDAQESCNRYQQLQGH
jgi:hypothetical protein